MNKVLTIIVVFVVSSFASQSYADTKQYFKSGHACVPVTYSSTWGASYEADGLLNPMTYEPRTYDYYCPIDWIFSSSPGSTYVNITGTTVYATASGSYALLCQLQVTNWDGAIYSGTASDDASGRSTLSVPNISDGSHPYGYYPRSAVVHCSVPPSNHINGYYYSVTN